MSNEDSPWWERFFNGDNRLLWSALRGRETPWAAHVLPWINLAQDANADVPLMLPRQDAAGRISWYCAGQSNRGALRLRETLQAFIGPSYSDFNGRPYPLNADDPVEAAFAEGTVSPTYRIRASKPADVARIQRAFELYRGLLGRMPNLAQQTRRPLGILRAELDRAIAAGDETEARRLSERIREIGRLDAENQLYLTVRVQAGLGQWREIAENGELLNQLTGLRLPPRVLADVHEALYWLYIEPSEDTRSPELALQAFRAAGLQRRSTLFSSRRGLRSPRVLKAFFLYAMVREDTDQLHLDTLASELEDVDDNFAHALAGLRPQKETPGQIDRMSAADAAFDDFEIDRALALYLEAPPSRKRLSRLIRCAEDIGTIEAARRVLNAIEPGDDAENLAASSAARLRSLQDKCATEQTEPTPHGWLDWAQEVEKGMDEDEAMTALRDHIVSWDSTSFSRDKEQIAKLTSIINNATGSSESLFREATPLLYRALKPESDLPSRHIKPLFQLLITKVAFFVDPSRNELELVRELTDTLLEMGLDKKEYASLVSDLKDLVTTQMSISTLGWSIDLVELLATHICPDHERRLRLVVRIVDQARRLSHRLSPAEILVLEDLCRDYEIDCPPEVRNAEQIESSELNGDLSGMRVGIYTLNESAGQRAATLLVSRWPTISVDLNSDHDCTKRLSNLARNADLFVFAWKSSKHQAFYCVKQHRNPEAPFVHAQGKGSSSILRAVLENR